MVWKVWLPSGAIITLGACLFPLTMWAADYAPPSASADLLKGIDFQSTVAIDEDYRAQFKACDDHNRFEEIRLTGHHTCTKDPNRARALLQLPNGAVYWESKMGLDVDGAWAAWNHLKGATDQKTTSYTWPNVDKRLEAAQINPDRFPFIVIPTDGLRKITGKKAAHFATAFAGKTGLEMGDMAVVIYKNKWTPVLIGDGGPFNKLGEASSKVFESLGFDRCKKWSADHQDCVGPGNREYPYHDVGIPDGVIFIAFAKSHDRGITPEVAIKEICTFAKKNVGLTGSKTCE